MPCPYNFLCLKLPYLIFALLLNCRLPTPEKGFRMKVNFYNFPQTLTVIAQISKTSYNFTVIFLNHSNAFKLPLAVIKEMFNKDRKSTRNCDGKHDLIG